MATENRKMSLALQGSWLVFIIIAFIVLVTLAILYALQSFNWRWFSIVVPIAGIGAIVAYLVLRHNDTPLRSILGKAQRMAKGEKGIDFSQEIAQSDVREFQELAINLAEIDKLMRNTRAEAAAEGRRQSQFVSDVAHELRTPLTAMRGAAETLEDEDIDYEDRLHFAQTIVSECDRLTRLANDLITLQHIEERKDSALQRTDMRTVVDHVAEVLAPLLDERGVRLSVGGEAPDVLGDPDRLQQVCVNLVENASRFAMRNESGGQVHVELSGVKKHTVITVSDNGPGFGEVDPARLFDRFYRGDFSRARNQGGSGLGLTIVKAIVNSYDGTVEAVNLPDGGACFIVAIPSLPPATVSGTAR